MTWFHDEAKYFKENGEVDLIKEALFGHDDPNAQLIDGVVYSTLNEEDEDGNKTVKAMVVITELRKEGDHYIVGCCHMDEDWGPAPTRCPESILNSLTPTTNFIAREWRRECWRNVKRNKSISGYTILDKNNKAIQEIKELTHKVLLKTPGKKQHGLFGDIEILDFDSDRVYLKANGTEFTIRMWDVIDRNKQSRIIWTLYKMIQKEGYSCGEEISSGASVVEISED